MSVHEALSRSKRSALADQRRRGRRHVAAGPAHAELDILRGQIAELEAGLTDPGAVKELALAVNRGSHIKISVGQFHGEVVGDLVSNTGVSGPGEIGPRCPLRE